MTLIGCIYFLEQLASLTRFPGFCHSTLFCFTFLKGNLKKVVSTKLDCKEANPTRNPSTNTNWLRFDARGNFTAGANIEVGYLTNPTDSSSFVSLQTVNIATLTYQKYTVTPGAFLAALLHWHSVIQVHRLSVY